MKRGNEKLYDLIIIRDMRVTVYDGQLKFCLNHIFYVHC